MDFPLFASVNEAFLNIAFYSMKEYTLFITVFFAQELFYANNFKKKEAHQLVDKMSENATWDDLIHEIYIRQVIEEGLADSEAGRTKDVGEVRAKYGLTE